MGTKREGCMIGGGRGKGTEESWDSPCSWEPQETSGMHGAPH